MLDAAARRDYQKCARAGAVRSAEGEEMSGHVFVSHGSDDRVQANELAAFVEAKGAKVWIAPRSVRPGQDYSEQLQEAIENCSAFLVLVTDKANKSPYVRAETEMAFSLSKPIFPVRLGDIKPAAGLAFFLKIRHWTDAFGPEREANLARLGRELQTAVGVPVDPTEVVMEAEARAAAALAGEAPPSAAPAPPAAPPAPPPPPPPAARAPVWQAPPPPIAGTAPTAPGVAASSASLPIGAIDPALLQAAVGPNLATYLARWTTMDAKGSAISWNWPACLFGFFWFAYRKMWLPMAGVFVANFALLAIAGGNPQFGQISWLFTIGISFVTGGFGNYLYRQQVEKLIEETAALGRQGQIEALTVRGGVSRPALTIAIGAVVIGSVLAVAAADPDSSSGRDTADNVVVPAENVITPPTPAGGVPGYDTPAEPEATTPPEPPQDGQGYPQQDDGAAATE